MHYSVQSDAYQQDPVSRRSIRAEGGIDIRESELRIVPTCFLHNTYAYD